MPDLKFTIPQNWDEDDVKWAIGRIAQIISGDTPVQQEGNSTRYSVDPNGNDWWAGYDMQDRQIKVSYRYSRPDDARMDALRVVIRWRLSMKDAVDATS